MEKSHWIISETCYRLPSILFMPSQSVPFAKVPTTVPACCVVIHHGWSARYCARVASRLNPSMVVVVYIQGSTLPIGPSLNSDKLKSQGYLVILSQYKTDNYLIWRENMVRSTWRWLAGDLNYARVNRGLAGLIGSGIWKYIHINRWLYWMGGSCRRVWVDTGTSVVLEIQQPSPWNREVRLGRLLTLCKCHKLV